MVAQLDGSQLVGQNVASIPRIWRSGSVAVWVERVRHRSVAFEELSDLEGVFEESPVVGSASSSAEPIRVGAAFLRPVMSLESEFFAEDLLWVGPLLELASLDDAVLGAEETIFLGDEPLAVNRVLLLTAGHL